MRFKPGQTHALACQLITSSSKRDGVCVAPPPHPGKVTHEPALQEVSPPVEERKKKGKEGGGIYRLESGTALTFPQWVGGCVFVVTVEAGRG